MEVMVTTVKATVDSIYRRGTNRHVLRSIKRFDYDDEDGMAYVAGLNWTRLISEYFRFACYPFLLYCSKLCVDRHTPIVFYIYRDLKFGEKGLFHMSAANPYFLDAFRPLYYHTFPHGVVSPLCIWLFTQLHSALSFPLT